MSSLFAWVVAASTLLAPARQHDQLAHAIVNRAEAEEPLFKGDTDRRKTAALLVAIAFREASLRPDAVGDHVAGKPTSFCAFQIHLPWGAKTAEGWTGADLIEDSEKCVAAAMHLLRASMRACPSSPLAWYASGPSGCENARAQRISRDRLAIAQRLARDVHEPADSAPAPKAPAPDDRASQVASPADDKASVASRPAAARPRRFCGGA